MGVIQDTTYVVALGLGFDRGENDYKVVRLVMYARNASVLEAEVYSLRLNAWRRISAIPPVSYHVHIRFSVWDDKCAFLNGVVYWIASQKPFGQPEYTFILAFDLGSEEFKRILWFLVIKCLHITVKVIFECLRNHFHFSI
ncbi:unnamed protein product [Prunus brigantina]